MELGDERVAIITGASRGIGNGIGFNALSPGVFDTPLHTGTDAATADAGMHPKNRIGSVSDIGHGALYLETVSFVTGEILHVDGGVSAGH